MKNYLRHKRHLILKGHDFFSVRHSGDDYYTVLPRRDGYCELFKNNEHLPFIIVRCYKDMLKAIGVGSRMGFVETIHLDDVEFLDFDGENNFVNEDSNEGFTASFDGEEVLLFAGEEVKPDRFHVEHSLG